METKRANAIPVLLAAVVLMAAALSVYVGGYLLSGEYALEDATVWRAYDHDWQVELFTPLGRAEKFITGHDVVFVRQPTPEELEEFNREFENHLRNRANP